MYSSYFKTILSAFYFWALVVNTFLYYGFCLTFYGVRVRMLPSCWERLSFRDFMHLWNEPFHLVFSNSSVST